MDEAASRTARLTVWEVAAVLELAATEIRVADAPTPTWEEVLARVRVARARQKIRIVWQDDPERKAVAIPYA